MPRKSPYTLNLNLSESHEGYTLLEKCPAPPGRKALLHQEKTLAAQGTGASRPALSQTQQQALAAKQKSRAMAIAQKPGQQILMNAFMMYMSGSSLNIFSISMVSTAILTPIASIFSLESTFSAFQNVDLQGPKILYLVLNAIWLCIGLYKMSTMRLLPTTSADFTWKLVNKQIMESTSPPPFISGGMMGEL